MKKITLCAACKEEVTKKKVHDCQKKDSYATGTITYQAKFFGLVKKVTRDHQRTPRPQHDRISRWNEYHGPENGILMFIAILLYGNGRSRRNLVKADGSLYEKIYFRNC